MTGVYVTSQLERFYSHRHGGLTDKCFIQKSRKFPIYTVNLVVKGGETRIVTRGLRTGDGIFF
jgi:hypothetical protein